MPRRPFWKVMAGIFVFVETTHNPNWGTKSNHGYAPNWDDPPSRGVNIWTQGNIPQN